MQSTREDVRTSARSESAWSFSFPPFGMAGEGCAAILMSSGISKNGSDFFCLPCRRMRCDGVAVGCNDILNFLCWFLSFGFCQHMHQICTITRLTGGHDSKRRVYEFAASEHEMVKCAKALDFHAEDRGNSDNSSLSPGAPNGPRRHYRGLTAVCLSLEDEYGHTATQHFPIGTLRSFVCPL